MGCQANNVIIFVIHYIPVRYYKIQQRVVTMFIITIWDSSIYYKLRQMLLEFYCAALSVINIGYSLLRCYKKLTTMCCYDERQSVQ